MTSRLRHVYVWTLLVGLLVSGGPLDAAKKKNKEKAEDPYADFVWPPPPDEARIKLENLYAGRADVEASSSFKRKLIGASPQTTYDELKKPFAVEIDSKGRILVTDWASSALIRFDREQRRMDVLGTKGGLRLQQPLGIGLGTDDTIYVADVGLKRVVGFDPEGKVVAVYGREGELVNPTDVAFSPYGDRIYVTDSKAHQVVVFDTSSGDLLTSFGQRGVGDGEFNFPSSLVFGPEGSLYVLDQLNSRIQVFSPDGDYIDQFGELGRGMGQFTRPKDVAVDEAGLIYVTDNAFNNVQIFDADFSLLTFVGEGGRGPGRFYGASGVAVRGDEFAVVDQLDHKVQVFRFLVPKSK